MTSAAVARKTAPPKGPRAGAAAKRRAALRSDKDGDVAMGGPTGRSRGGITKSKPPTGPASDLSVRKTRSGATAGRMKADIARHVSNGTLSSRLGSRASGRDEGLCDVRITGWENSKASTTSEDGGVSSLITWLEKKATLKSSLRRPVKLKKKKVEPNILLVSVPKEQVTLVTRLNGFEFAGKSIQVERVVGGEEEISSTTKDTIEMLRGVLARRYNTDMKLLDLSALGQDAELKASSIFDKSSTTSKFFPAMMKVLDQQFETPALKHEAVQSVTLANNDLKDLKAVTALSHTLPQLKNLDLSNNNFSKIEDIETWRHRFGRLDHLVMSNNPLEQSDPNLAKTLVGWYPRLRMLNGVQVRTDEEAAKGFQITDLPFPVRSPDFQDEGQIAENFVRTFFTGYDTDRPALARMYYDDKSTFTFAVNTSAKRDPAAVEASGPQDWEAYIKGSRNLTKISHPPARVTRKSTGTAAVTETWSGLPPTRHPDLAAQAKKWLIECHLQPGLPDPSSQSAGGVDGFLITIHGEYDELDAATGQAKKQRSFDRTFLIGPGGPSGVRVINDMLTVRAYGGSAAFEPGDDNANNATNGEIHPTLAPGLPQGLTTELAEQMVLELQKQTKMTVGYAKDCLEQVAWDFERALQAFAAVSGSLPADAFVQGV